MAILRTWLLSSAAVLCLSAALAQGAPTGMAHTPEVDLAYYTLGADRALPPVFAVNGGPGLTHAYMVRNDLWTRVAARRRVVFYDQRGDGLSSRVSAGAPQTLEAQVADLDAVRAALGAQRIDLVGDSYGGLVVLAYTLAHPEHVRRLVVSDGLPGWPAIVHPMDGIFPDLDEEETAHEQTLPKGSQAADEYGFRMHLRKCFASPEVAARYLNGFSDLGLNRTVGAAVNAATRDVNLSPRLGEIKAETLILTGRWDVNVAPLTAWRMSKAIPGAQFHVFEHSGHLPSYEEPEAYLRTLDAFLNR